MTRAEARVPFFLLGRFLARSNPWTLALTVLMMAIAFINLIFVASLFNGIVRGSDEQIINAYVGHVTVGPPEGQRAIEHADAELARVLRTPGVVGASAQTNVPAMMQYGTITLARPVLAIDPDRERTVTDTASRIVAGAYLRPGDTDGILLGIQVAGGPDVEQNATSFRGARVGDTVRLTMGPVVRDFTVRGIYRTKFVAADTRAFITERALEAMDPTAHDRASVILVRATRRGDERATIDALRRAGVTGTFGTWQDSAGLMKSVTKSFTSINVLMSFVGVSIAAVTIFIVVYIDIVNRRRQIGILRAIGVKAWIIRLTYVLQSAVYSLAGVAVGAAIFFAALVPWFVAHPFALPICDASLDVDPADLARRAGGVVLVAAISGLVPAVIVTRMRILTAVLGQ